MKLKDILARELKAWPESWGIFCVASKIDGADVAWFDYRSPVFKGGAWQDVGSVELLLSQEPEDRNEVVVRRFEWQDAVEALKAEQVAELKWPDGAEFSGCGVVGIFYRNVNPGQFERWSPNESKWFTFNGSPMYTPLIPRPTERAVEWDGVGVPPVGTVCAVLNSTLGDPAWERCTILYSGKHRVMYDSESCEERVAFIQDLKFRKAKVIRTQEQIAAEDREKAINEMVYGACGCEPDGNNTTAFVLCGLLYDAFYRKQVAE